MPHNIAYRAQRELERTVRRLRAFCATEHGAGKTEKGRFQVKALVLLAGVMIRKKGMYNGVELPGLAMPMPSRYSSLQIPPFIGLGRRERDERGFRPLVLYTRMTMLI